MTASHNLRVVIDTNVFISGILFGGIPRRIITLVKTNRLLLLMSVEVANEWIQILERFPTTQTDLDDASYILTHRVIRVTPKVNIRKSRDLKDDMLLALSFAGKADYLITGDKDLLVMRNFEKTKIVTPRQFLLKFK